MGILFGRFPLHGGTPSHHPFLDGIFPEIKPIQQLLGSPHDELETPIFHQFHDMIWVKTTGYLRHTVPGVASEYPLQIPSGIFHHISRNRHVWFSSRLFWNFWKGDIGNVPHVWTTHVQTVSCKVWCNVTIDHLGVRMICKVKISCRLPSHVRFPGRHSHAHDLAATYKPKHLFHTHNWVVTLHLNAWCLPTNI